MDILVIIIVILAIITILDICGYSISRLYEWIYGYDEQYVHNTNNINKEEFGALQSLYSNDGIQDTHLTINSDSGHGWGHGWGGYWGKYDVGYNPFRYWRGVPWNLPTRNLSRVSFYPYLYEYYLDRYGRFYPYW